MIFVAKVSNNLCSKRLDKFDLYCASTNSNEISVATCNLPLYLYLSIVYARY